MKKLLVISGLMLLVSCGKSIDLAEWTEEVQLHSGEKIFLNRKMEAYSYGFPNSSRGSDIGTELQFADMGVSWGGKFSENWIRRPVSFEIFDNTPYIVLSVGDLKFCRDKPNGHPELEIIKWKEGRWEQVEINKFPMDKALINMSVSYWGVTKEQDYKGVVRWLNKQLPGIDVGKEPETVKSYFSREWKHCGYK